MARSESWQDDLRTYPKHFQDIVNEKLGMETKPQEPTPQTVDDVLPIIPPQLWEPPPPPQITVVNVGGDHATGQMLMLAIALVLLPLAIIGGFLLSNFPVLLLGIALGAAMAIGLGLTRRNK